MNALSESAFDSTTSVEDLICSLLAASSDGDPATSNSIELALRSAMMTANEERRIAIVHAIAAASLARNDPERADSELRRCLSHREPNVRLRHLQLAAELASCRGRSVDQADFLVEAFEVLESCPDVDMPLAATLLHSVSTVIRETSLIDHVAETAIELCRSLPWSDDLAATRSSCAIQFAWIRAMDGDLMEALRFGQRAFALAPDSRSRFIALVERAKLRAIAGEVCSAQLDTEDALAAVGELDLEAASEDLRLALAGLAKLTVTTDSDRARALIMSSKRLRAAGNRRAEGISYHATGVVARVTGDDQLASTSFQAAYEIFEQLGSGPRASQAALAMHGVTGEKRWLQIALDRIRRYPRSWIAEAARRATTGSSDEAASRLTPRQREVFRALLEGLQAETIGVRIGAAPNTVRNHIQAIYTIFSVCSQPELLVEARKRSLV